MPDTLEVKEWGILFIRIKDGNCTPCLGFGVCLKKIYVNSQIANEWAKKHGYPMEDYFYEVYTQVYCYNYRKFATELKTQWEAFDLGT